MKTCRKCGEEKPLVDFPKNKSRKDGHLNECKECYRKYANNYYATHQERINAKARKRCAENSTQYNESKSEWVKNNLDKRREMYNTYAKKNPLKVKAYRVVNRAIKDGTLEKLPCQQCGEPKVDAHHSDYTKPLEVTWLCRKCHKTLHRLTSSLK